MIRGLVSCLVLLSLTACQTVAPVVGDAGPVLGQVQRVEYRLGAGDQIRVIVFGEEALSGEFFIDGNGSVSLPLIGEVTAGDRTLREFEEAVAHEFRAGYLNDPRVSAEVLNYRPFYILGEVEEAGEYPFSEDLTVMNAVATAGGFTYRANTRVVYIKHAGSVTEVAYPLTSTVPVLPGDTVRISERFF